jgi:hypothetical protein
MTEHFILLVKMSTKQFGRLIDGMLDLDCHTTARLRLLDDLIMKWNQDAGSS